jgi:DNA-binding NarL/FixJ family response regulator
LLHQQFEIVAEVGDGQAAVAAAETHKPDIILLDVSLPRLRGFDAARNIRANQPATKILFVSNYAEKAYAEEAERLGASGYVLKSRAVTQLLPAVKMALSGQFYSGL